MSTPIETNTTQLEELLQIAQGLPSQSTAAMQSKTVTPSNENQTVRPDSGYDGLSSVTVEGDSDLVSGNIKSGVTIFGVAGSFVGGVTVQRKTGSFTPSDGGSTVSCGFKPDLVVIENGTLNSRTQTLSFPFYEVGESATIRSISEYTGTNEYADYIVSCQADCKLTSSGFQISGFTKYYYTGDESDYDESVNYIAIKYT